MSRTRHLSALACSLRSASLDKQRTSRMYRGIDSTTLFAWVAYIPSLKQTGSYVVSMRSFCLKTRSSMGLS